MSLRTNFVKLGEGQCVVFLHGWGSNLSDFQGSTQLFSRNFCTINLDLWGFGKSEEPPADWNSEHYVLELRSFLKELGVAQAHLVGHSFGGKLAAKFCAQFPENCLSLILVDSAGIPKKLSFLQKKSIKRYKKLKKLAEMGKVDAGVLEKYGSDDWKESSQTMRKIMANVVREDCTQTFKNICVPTLIVWGKNDKITPVAMGYKIHRLISGSRFEVLEGGHFCHIDNFVKFNRLCLEFWGRI